MICSYADIGNLRDFSTEYSLSIRRVDSSESGEAQG